MKRLQRFAAALVLTLGISSLSLVPAGAINVTKDACTGDNVNTAVCKATTSDSAGSLAKKIVNTLLVVIGIISVIMIIVGGIRYTLSNGDASQIKSAKDTVLYAVIGIVVALLAYAIVNFVLGKF
jgi:hypothetical protein